MSDDDNIRRGLKIFSMFDEGKRFTEALLEENEKLRLLTRNLTHEKTILAKKLGDDNVKLLEDKLRIQEEELSKLRKEAEQLKEETAAMEAENREFAERYVSVERQISDLINMYVASYQLHSTLDYDEVLVNLKDITINMLGAEIFGVFLVDSEAKKLSLIAHEGLDGRNLESIPLTAKLEEKIATPPQNLEGTSVLKDKGDDEPLLYIPLKLDDMLLAVIVVYKLLIQKDSFVSFDSDLIELLGKHAATAIYSARLHTASERKRNTLEGFVELIKGDIPEKK